MSIERSENEITVFKINKQQTSPNHPSMIISKGSDLNQIRLRFQGIDIEVCHSDLEWAVEHTARCNTLGG